MAAPFSMPTVNQMVSILGHNGSGKSQEAVWYLSQAQIETMPWVAIDYKGDELINSIPYHQDIGFNDVPKKPGVYILHPRPDQDEHVDRFLWGLWERGNTGLFVDEAYSMPKFGRKGAYETILIQGRSKRIPRINVSQKPSWVPTQIFSEADFINVFHLSDRNDHRRVNDFTPIDCDAQIPEFCSWSYRIKDRSLFGLQPVPDADSLLEIFARRLAPKRRVI